MIQLYIEKSIIDKIFKDTEEATNFIVNFNKSFFLDGKDYIKSIIKFERFILL